MRYPEFLHEGGRIGFIAPSFGCATEPYREQFEKALEHFKAKGYKTILGPNCFLDEGIGISNTPQKCAEEVNEFFTEDCCDTLISCGGGELMCEILPYVDFGAIGKARPKWFAGYSDNTNLTFLLNVLCDTASLYAPCASKYHFEEAPQYVNDAFDMMCGQMMSVHNYKNWYREVKSDTISESEDWKEIPGCDLSLSGSDECEEYVEIELPYRQYIFARGSKASETAFSGRFIGGCLDCLVTLVGTEFDKTCEYIEKYSGDGFVWFIESCDLTVMGIRRALWQMEEAGWFKYVKGFLIGRPYKFDDTFGEFDHYKAVTGILGRLNVPIVMDVDIGHLDPMMPIMSGAIGHVCAGGNALNIEFEMR